MIKMKFLNSIYEFNNIDTYLNKDSSIEDKEMVFNFLKENIRRFMNRKDIDLSLNKFLKTHHINIDIDKELTYKNIFDFLNNTSYDDSHCSNIDCNKDTKFDGFNSIKQYPRGYHQFCCKKCMSKWFSDKQMGLNNTFHRMDKEKMPEFKKKMSNIMKDMIEKGDFTPNLINSWHNTKFKTIINNDVVYFRSCWEAFFNIVNPTLRYEKRRIPYGIGNDKHTYIVDFDDITNKILYEIKPISMEEIEKNIIKKKSVIEWCNKNDYKFIIINDNWFKLNYSKYKHLLEDQPDKERIMKNLRRYDNKENN